jgi:sirohydrochlorin ferrochelatase
MQDAAERERAILVVDHGSRRADANAVLESVAEALRRRMPDRTVQIAHMELAEPSIERGIDACVASGAREIVVHPYFLARGYHTSDSIPALVRAAAARHPEVRVVISEPLGPHPALVDVVVERIESVSQR